MTVQIVEIAGQKMAVLPVSDYERLIDAVEDRDDLKAAVAAQERRDGGEDYLPAEMVDRILAGDNALRVWREHRNLTQLELSLATGRRDNVIGKLECGENIGSVKLWQKIAERLRVSVDDIQIPDTSHA